jgi:hypothetical protein
MEVKMMDTYEIEFRRRSNGETIALIAFYSETEFNKTIAELIQKFNLRKLLWSRKNEERYAVRMYARTGVVVVFRHHCIRPSVRAMIEAERLLA